MECGLPVLGKHWREVKRRPDGFDLVLSDLTMPGMTGVEFAEELSRVAPSMPVIVATGYHPEGSDLMNGPIRAALTKPFRAEEPDSTIRRVLDGAPADRSWKDPSVGLFVAFELDLPRGPVVGLI